MNTIKATGTGTDRPNISFSGGRGNTDKTEIWIYVRGNDEGGETTKSVYAWYPAAEILKALTDAIQISEGAE